MDRPKMLKSTILSLSLLTIVSTGAVAPALGEIGKFFASSDHTLVQLVAVMHAVALVPSLLLAGRAAERFSAKKRLFWAGWRFFCQRHRRRLREQYLAFVILPVFDGRRPRHGHPFLDVADFRPL